MVEAAQAASSSAARQPPGNRYASREASGLRLIVAAGAMSSAAVAVTISSGTSVNPDHQAPDSGTT